MHLFNRSSSLAAGILSLVLLAQNTLFAHTSETNFWTNRSESRRDMASLPSSLPLRSADISPLSQRFSVQETLPSPLSPDLSIPLSLGSVRKISSPKQKRADRVIIHIQDVHMNTEAQTNIGKT